MIVLGVEPRRIPGNQLDAALGRSATIPPTTTAYLSTMVPVCRGAGIAVTTVLSSAVAGASELREAPPAWPAIRYVATAVPPGSRSSPWRSRVRRMWSGRRCRRRQVAPNALLTPRLPARSAKAMLRGDSLAAMAVVVIVERTSMCGGVRGPICVVGPARRHRWALLLLGDRRRIVAGGGIGLCAGSFLKKG